MSTWKFLTNHAIVLIHLNDSPTITARELALEIGITERAVRKIISDLELEGYLIKDKIGRRLRFQINSNLPFRHHTQKDKPLEKLLSALNGSLLPEPEIMISNNFDVQPLGSGI